MVRLAAVGVLVVAIALSGCLSGSAPTSNSVNLPPLPALPKLPFTEALALPDGTNNGEPSLAIDLASGIVYGSAPGGSKLWVSTDNGTSFTATTPSMAPAPHQGGFDSDIAIDAAGRLYFADLWLESTTVSVSEDQGKTWFDQPVASGTVLNDRQWITATKDGTAYLAYNQLATGPWVSRTTDAGRTWVAFPAFATAIGPMGYKSQLDFFSMGNIKADPEGTLYMTWTAGNALAPNEVPGYPYISAVMVSTSTDGAQTWTHHVAATLPKPVNYLLPILAIDQAGMPYVTWSAPGADGWDVFLSTSADKGATWSEPLALSEPGGSNVMPFIAAGAPGHVWAVWYGADEAKDPNEVAGEWHVRIAHVVGADGAAPSIERGLAAKEANHKGPICTYGILCDGGRELLDYFEVQLDAAGAPHVIWTADFEADTTQIYYAHMLAAEVPAPTMAAAGTSGARAEPTRAR